MSNPATHKKDESLNLQVTAIDHDEQCINISDVKQALMEDPLSILLGDLICNL